MTFSTATPKKRGIPTTYRGIRFRSRLEAQWAAFFDLLRWDWEYEPFDLEGYIPDFVLKWYKPMLVEVKPYFWPTDEKQFEEAQNKVLKTSWANEFIVVGASLPPATAWGDMYAIGAFMDRDCGGDARDEGLLAQCHRCGNYMLMASSMSFRCRVCGYHDGDHHVGDLRNTDVPALWVQAKNEVQWKGGR